MASSFSRPFLLGVIVILSCFLPLSKAGAPEMITHYYWTILNRDPDPQGLDYFVAQATLFSPYGASEIYPLFNIAEFFLNSQEFKNRNVNDEQYVDLLYQTFFNRTADSKPEDPGKQFLLSRLQSGMKRQIALLYFLHSPDFFEAVQAQGLTADASRIESDVVLGLYRGIFQRVPDEGGFKFWTNRFREIQCQPFSERAAALYDWMIYTVRAFMTSAEYTAASANDYLPTKFVLDLLNTILRRPVDNACLKHWVTRIETGAVSYDDLVSQIIGSPEAAVLMQSILSAPCTSLIAT